MNTESDVVVIGSGVSGLAAAVTAAEGGAKVIVFEKQRSLGGTSNFFEGIFAVESELQRQRFIDYSRDEAFKNIMEYNHWRANARLVRAFVNESAKTIAWLQKQGVEFIGAASLRPGGPSPYHVINGKGEAVIKALATSAKEKGVDISPATPVKKILREGDRITGVVAEAENGEEIQVAARVVVVASGGYANNKEWIKKYAGFDLDVNVIPVGNVDKMGDGIRMAWEVGAAEEGMGVLEMGNANARYKEGYTFSIFDDSIKQRLLERGIDRYVGWKNLPGTRLTGMDEAINDVIEKGTTEVFKADSVEELAVKIGIDPAVLRATVDEYNGFCEKGHDDLFAKDTKYLWPLKGPKYYAVRERPLFLGTLGGVKINHRAEVVDKRGKVIPGLYAAGFDAGGAYGDSYSINDSPGMSAGFSTNSGRIAGKNALKYIGK